MGFMGFINFMGVKFTISFFLGVLPPIFNNFLQSGQCTVVPSLLHIGCSLYGVDEIDHSPCVAESVLFKTQSQIVI